MALASGRARDRLPVSVRVNSGFPSRSLPSFTVPFLCHSISFQTVRQILCFVYFITRSMLYNCLQYHATHRGSDGGYEAGSGYPCYGISRQPMSLDGPYETRPGIILYH